MNGIKKIQQENKGRRERERTGTQDKRGEDRKGKKENGTEGARMEKQVATGTMTWRKEGQENQKGHKRMWMLRKGKEM